MAEETFNAFRERRKRELQSRIAALKGQLRETLGELHEIQRSEETDAKTSALGGQPNKSALEELLSSIPPSDAKPDPAAVRALENVTIGELIARALRDGFPKGGSAQQIREFIRVAYGRDIQQDSFRSQLARMKAQGRIEQNPLNEMWSLTFAGQLFDNPTSWPRK